jgi:hypothetical protein
MHVPHHAPEAPMSRIMPRKRLTFRVFELQRGLLIAWRHVSLTWTASRGWWTLPCGNGRWSASEEPRTFVKQVDEMTDVRHT